MKKLIVITAVIMSVVLLVGAFLSTEGMSLMIVGSNDVKSEEPTNTPEVGTTVATTVAPTATPVAATEDDVKVIEIAGRKILVGEEENVVKYVSNLNQQEWLDLAEISESYYARKGKDDAIVVIDDSEVNAFDNAEASELVEVLRAGEAFCVEASDGGIAEDDAQKVGTMSDKGIYSTAFCREHEALRSTATVAKMFPNANVRGTLEIARGFNPSLFKGLVLVKHQVTDDEGNEVSGFAIAWRVCDCTQKAKATTSHGGGSGSSGKKDPAPTKVPENNSEPKADATKAPSKGNENNSEPKADATKAPSKGNESSSEPKAASAGSSSTEVKADPTPKNSGGADTPVKKNEEW